MTKKEVLRMQTLRHGPRMVINAKPTETPNKGKEVVMIEKIPAPPAINSFTHEAEEYVKNWYRDVEKRPRIQARETTEEFSFVPAPPCIMGLAEEER